MRGAENNSAEISMFLLKTLIPDLDNASVGMSIYHVIPHFSTGMAFLMHKTCKGYKYTVSPSFAIAYI
jgi:hypothetical protein